MIIIDDNFHTENRSVLGHFQRQQEGFFIPLYQRGYSWDNDNIEQLLEDISRGVENILFKGDDEIRFMGTIISVIEKEKENIQPDVNSLPRTVEKIIDGQQRLSTFALFAAMLAYHLDVQKANLNKLISKEGFDVEKEEFFMSEVVEITNYWHKKLISIFALDLDRGNPTLKPKIIRESVDKWVMKEPENRSYKSPVSEFLFRAIDYFHSGTKFPKPSKRSSHQSGKNLARIETWLNDTVLVAHYENKKSGADEFVSATDLLTGKSETGGINQEYIWQYKRLELEGIIEDGDTNNPKSFAYGLCSLVQLLSVCHYLLERCCFTVIQPKNDDWAFDMFQSLNATGTPLTAIETFKPLVANTLKIEEKEFKGSLEEKYFNKIEDAFKGTSSAAQKSKRANDLLTSFALPINGERLRAHFSAQRKWLEEVYEDKLGRFEEKQRFIKFFGNYALFFREVWMEDKKVRGVIDKLSLAPDAEMTSLLVHFLIDSNHKMAITILAPLFHRIIEGEPNSISNFSEIVKLLAGFYTIWRSAQGNSRLDDAYRSFFKEDQGTTFTKKFSFSPNEIRKHFKKILNESDFLSSKEIWLDKARGYLAYNTSRSVCKLALFISAHDTIPDPNKYGLMKEGTKDCSVYMTSERWNSPSLKSIEHIAPQKEKFGWDDELYGDDELFQSIGNLTLLPLPINSSAGNKGWLEKCIYYKHLSSKDPDKYQELANRASASGVILNEETLDMLKNASYAGHIDHIVTISENVGWSGEIVKARAERILEIVWSRAMRWIK